MSAFRMGTAYLRVPIAAMGIRWALRQQGVPVICTVSYAVLMTTKGTTGRVVRVDKETWDEYAEVCAAKGLSRAADLRVYINREISAHRRRLAAEQRDAGAARTIAES